MPMPKVPLGSQGLQVSKQGLGCMGMSAFYGAPKPEEEMIPLIRHAVDSGITFLDTSDIYGPFLNEILLGKALKGIRHKVQLATKFGAFFSDDGTMKLCGHPAYVRSACEASLKRLDVDCIDLYYQHRIDVTIPIEVTVGELKKLVEEGKVKYIGLSEPSASTIRRAHAVHPITAVQLEWSLWSREVEEEIIPTCRELGIGIVAYSPLGRGFFSMGAKLLEGLNDTDFRKAAVDVLPRFSKDNLDKNEELFLNLHRRAAAKGCTTGQLALAWVQHQGDDVVPIPGTTRMKNLEENAGAIHVSLTREEIDEISASFRADKVSGNRCGDAYIADGWTFASSDTPPLSSWEAASHQK